MFKCGNLSNDRYSAISLATTVSARILVLELNEHNVITDYETCRQRCWAQSQGSEYIEDETKWMKYTENAEHELSKPSVPLGRETHLYLCNCVFSFSCDL